MTIAPVLDMARVPGFRDTLYSIDEMREFWAHLGHAIDGEGQPLPKMRRFQRTALEAEGKTTMAHVMFDLGAFASVGEAKRNGWNKPLVIGTHSAAKKTISFKITDS